MKNYIVDYCSMLRYHKGKKKKKKELRLREEFNNSLCDIMNKIVRETNFRSRRTIGYLEQDKKILIENLNNYQKRGGEQK